MKFTFSFSRIYLSLFLTYFRVFTQLCLIICIKFLLFWTQKIVYYASALYYVKFVGIMCIKHCLLSRSTYLLPEALFVRRIFMIKPAATAAAAAARMRWPEHCFDIEYILNLISLVKMHYKYNTHIIINMSTAKMPPT